MSENEEFIHEFLEECAENLDQLDKDLVALEKDPSNARLLANIFRTIHTVKGTSGFFGFAKLGAITHDGESLLGRLRDGELVLNQQIATALLNLVDAIRAILAEIEKTGKEGTGDFQGLSAELIRLTLSPSIEPTAADESGGFAAADSHLPETVAEADQQYHEPVPVDGPSVASVAESVEPKTGSISSTATDGHIAGEVEPAKIEHEVPATAAAPTPEISTSSVSEGSIRVDVGLLNELVDLAGELVLARNQLHQFAALSEDRAFLNTVQKLSMITSELQEGVMQTRMQPMSTIWGKFPRVVRDLAIRCEKEVRLEQFGEETELDRTLLEAIRDPLTHLIRNAVDHGIELPAVREHRGKPRQGCVQLRAYHESGQVHIEITDDGGGIDVQRVKQRTIERGVVSAQQAANMSDEELAQLIFLPGFSTAETVTAVSGRGVGMDVVRTHIEQIRGTVELQNRPGLGTTVHITIPLTLAIIPALIVSCQGESFAIPQLGVIELLSFPAEKAAQAIEWIHDAPVYRLREQLLPIIYLADVLQLLTSAQPKGQTAAAVLPCSAGVEGPLAAPRSITAAAPAEGHIHLVVLQGGGGPYGLIVDKVIDTQEIVVKPLGRILQGISAYAGATILGDGTVALILDVTGLSRQAGLSLAQVASDQAPADRATAMSRPVVLCETGVGRQIAIALDDVERLEEIPAAHLECAAGRPAVQYGGQIMPLIDSAAVLDPRQAASALTHDPLRIVVGRGETGGVGLVVSQILDIVDCPRGTPDGGHEHGCVVESVVLADRITDVINWSAVVQAAGVSATAGSRLPSGTKP